MLVLVYPELQIYKLFLIIYLNFNFFKPCTKCTSSKFVTFQLIQLKHITIQSSHHFQKIFGSKNTDGFAKLALNFEFKFIQALMGPPKWAPSFKNPKCSQTFHHFQKALESKETESFINIRRELWRFSVFT